MKKKFGRKKDHREHMERNLLTSLVLYEKIDTTKTKAKDISSSFDKLMTTAKKNNDNAKKKISSVLFDSKSAAKVFEVLVPRYKNRASGYTTMINLSNRKGDNSTICRLELMDKKATLVEKKTEDKKEIVKTTKDS